MLVTDDIRRELDEAVEIHREIQEAEARLAKCKERIRQFAVCAHPAGQIDGGMVELRCSHGTVSVVFPAPKFSLLNRTSADKVLEMVGHGAFGQLFEHKAVLRDDAEAKFRALSEDDRRRLTGLLGPTVQSPRVVFPK